MKKYTLNLLHFFLALTLLVIAFFPTYAASTKVYDQADLLSTSEETSLQASIDELISTYQIDVGIVLSNSMDGKTSRAYADDFYDGNGFGIGEDYSGLLMLINMEDREVYISTCGKAISYFTDARINTMLDQITPYLKGQNYMNACTSFLNEVEDKLALGIPNNQYTVEEKGFKFSLTHTLIYLFVALIFSLLTCFGVKKSYSRPTSISGRAYINQYSVNFTRRLDTFLGSHISRTKRESSNNSSGGGRSTTHSSSSGRSHGGGGRSF